LANCVQNDNIYISGGDIPHPQKYPIKGVNNKMKTIWQITFAIPGVSRYLEVEGYGDDHAERIKAQIKDANGKLLEIKPKGKN
jgi:hypothetical protein